MIKCIMLSIIITCFLNRLEAHQPELSTTMLIEHEKGKWLLQVRSALTAFQYEIKTTYGEGAYATAEEFQNLVLEYLKDKIKISFNENDIILLNKGYVKLGHETNVVFELKGVPSDIQSLSIQNNAFDDISRSQGALIVAKDGYSKEQFVLNSKNEYKVELMLENKQLILIEKNIQEDSFFIQFGGLISLSMVFMVGLILLIYRSLDRKKELLLE